MNAEGGKKRREKKNSRAKMKRRKVDVRVRDFSSFLNLVLSLQVWVKVSRFLAI